MNVVGCWVALLMIRCILVMLMPCFSNSCLTCSSVALVCIPLMTSSLDGALEQGLVLCFRASLQVICAPLNVSSGHGESRLLREWMSLGKIRILPFRMSTSF